MPYAVLVLYAVALVGTRVIGPGGPVYWDSFGYVGQALSGQVGGLALGRPVFVLTSHGIARGFRALGGSVWSLEPVLRGFWSAVAALAAPGTYALARECGLSPRASLLAGLCVALSPAMAHTSDAVLTDAPSVALSVLSFVLAARASAPVGTRSRGRRVLCAAGAGLVLGVACGLREQAVVQLVVLALMLPRTPRGERWRVALAAGAAFAVAVAGPLAYVLATQPGYPATVGNWVRAMRRERAEHHGSVRDVLYYGAWLVALGPWALLAAARAWATQRAVLLARWSVALAVTLPSLVQLGLLGAYQDISYSPRYLLCALPGAVAIPAGVVFERWVGDARGRWAALAVMLALPLVATAPVLHASERALLAMVRSLPGDLRRVPARSAVVTGQLCPAVELVGNLTRAEGRAGAGDWQRVCPGWAWPPDLARLLDQARAEDRRVVLDLRLEAWLGPGQRASRAQAVAYLRERPDAWARGEIIVWR